MKRALLIGIDNYDAVAALSGCVNDATAIEPLLGRNENGSPNFDCRLLTSNNDRVDRRTVLGAIDELLKPGADVALFYFAGHGDSANHDVVLVTQDGCNQDLGVTFSHLMGKAQNSQVPEVIVILDCCFSGSAGSLPQLGTDIAALRGGVSILTASRGDQTAAETADGRGLFSKYFCGALEGGAADVLGKVTVAGVYAYLSESFGPWDQRPTFKANLDRLNVLRSCDSAVPLEDLRKLPSVFSSETTELPLDPSYEPDAQPPHPEHEKVFGILQKCRAAKLVEPIGADHMYYAAVESKACRLTLLGRHYWRLANQKRL
ncbi:MAG: caspase family protein [Candidatus Hydrogenedentes bacterium]|nr:caspase family protein [Candidatus Hydrogenedentota bacterium]